LLLPLTWLPAFKREAAARMSHAWPAGYCPCGGSWPACAAICGLEQVR